MFNIENMDDVELARLIDNEDEETGRTLREQADAVRKRYYGTAVYIRGLIELTNYCRNNCFYCGIRAGNTHAVRYRLTEDTVLDCCETGYTLGFRTFVLQGGEDPAYTDARICGLVSAVRERFPDCAITLSIGEKPYESYKAYFVAGADRYLLRHETANPAHYARLHPGDMDADRRKECLWHLKEIGYQVGAGFLTGSPFQTTAHLVEDLRFLQQLQPDMIGIGPFIPHAETPFAAYPGGSLQVCLRMISILRLLFPYALIPATTALGTIHPQGRERGLQAGANVVMPNLSPTDTRALYTLYDNKICTGEEAAEGLSRLRQTVKAAGYEIVTDIGHVKRNERKANEN